MRNCSHCGHSIPEDDRYCPNCGRVRNVPKSLDRFELGIIENFKHCVVHKYADFDGRGSRSEYWYFMLGYQLIFATILFICAIISYLTPKFGNLGVGLGLTLLVIISVGLVVPALAASVRRLHDVGWSGWLVLVGLVPFVGLPALLVLMAWPGQASINRYGNPTGTKVVTRQLANEIGLIDTTPSTPFTLGLVTCLIVMWVLVDRLLAS